MFSALFVVFAGCLARPGPSPALSQAQAAFEAKRYAEVLAALGQPRLQKLRSRDLRRAYEVLGQSHERLGHPDQALRVYQLGVALFPKDVNLLTYLANLLHRAGLDSQARPYYERILRLSPANAAAHLGLAETERSLGFLDRAASHYQAALAGWGDQPSIWRDYAEVLGAQRKTKEALEAIAAALKLADDADSRLDEARLLWRSGRREEAFGALDKARALAPARAGLSLERGLWSLEAGDLAAAGAAAAGVLSSSPEDPLALWLRASVALRSGKPEEARRDLELAARQGAAPFIAAAAEAMLKQLR